MAPLPLVGQSLESDAAALWVSLTDANLTSGRPGEEVWQP